jgi:uncharacterized protein (TIGR02594 family)
MSLKAALVDTVHGVLSDKMTMLSAGLSLGVIATWEVWLRHANGFAAANLPLATFAMVCTTILVRLLGHFYPREPSTATGAKDAAGTAWGWAKRFGWVFGAVVAAGAAIAFWKASHDNKALPAPQQLVSTPSGKRSRRSADDAGDEGDAESDGVPDPNDLNLPPWFLTAKGAIGTDERLPNGRANPEVKKMFAAVDGFDPAKVDCRNVPWCAVFVNWCLAQCGVSGTRSAMARSFTRSRAFKELPEPRIGCIVVFFRGQYDDGETGHVGFYAGDAGRYVNVLGGNQGDTVKVAKFPKGRVLGYYWPRGALESRTARGTATAAVAASAGTGAVAYSELSDDAPAGAHDTVTSTVETVRNGLEQVQQPLEASGHPKAMHVAAMIGIALLALSIGAALYAYWRHAKDHSEGRL